MGSWISVGFRYVRRRRFELRVGSGCSSWPV